MKLNYLFLGFVTVFLVFFLTSPSIAVRTSEIDKVRKKSVLDDEDFEIINNFLADAMTELLGTENFSSVSQVRMAVLSRTTPDEESAQTQYQVSFFNSAYKQIGQALEKCLTIASEARRFRVTSNILILLDGLLAGDERQARLLELAVKFINDKNEVVRYWALRCVTNPDLRQWLRVPGNSAVMQQVLNQMQEVVNKARPETIKLIISFLAEIDASRSNEVLLQVADMRMKKYSDWVIKNELLDMTVLKALYTKISSAQSGKPELARRFGQLYSYAMQMYIRDLQGGGFLTKDSRNQLISVLVEVENKCIGPLLGVRAESIRKAIENDDVRTLLQEHERLLGSEAQAGRLTQKLGFNYGTTKQGKVLNGPLLLPERPKEKAS